MTWMRATSTSGTQQKYAQYSLTDSRVPPEGMYHISLLAHAEGGDGMARCYVKKPDSSYLPVYAITAPDGQTVTVAGDFASPSRLDCNLGTCRDGSSTSVDGLHRIRIM